MKRPNVSMRLNVPWLRVLVIVLVVLQLLDPNKAWMIVLTGFGGLWLLSYLWCRELSRGLRLRREQLYGWLQVGDWVEERFTLGNYSSAPATWVSIEDSSDLPGYAVSLGTGIESKAERRWMKRTPCERRGMYHLGPVTLRSGDIFGIYSVEVTYPERETFVVSPPVIRLPYDIQVVSGRRMDESRLSRIRMERSIISISAREYLPGDSFTKIHWMITARNDEPYVREFENIHASDAWWILLDLDSQSQVGTGEDATDEHAIILAASLADQGLRSGKAVGLIAHGDEFVLHPARHGFSQRSNILRSLALVQRGTSRAADLILQSQPYLHQHSNIILITSSVQRDWIEKLDRLRMKEITPTVLLVSSAQEEHARSLRKTGDLLTRRGIVHHTLSPALFTTPETRPGHRGEIKWKFTPMGRAIMIRSDGGGA